MRHSFTTLTACSVIGLALLASSCRKEQVAPTCQGDCTTVSGQLTTGQAPVGIANVPVEIKWIKSNGLFVKGVSKASTTTDADGRYSLSFNIEDNELTEGSFVAYFNPDANQYYTYGPDRESADLPNLARSASVVVRTYHIPRKAYVRLAITNPADLRAGGTSSQFFSELNTCHGFNTVFSRALQGGGSVFFWNNLPVENPLPVPGDQSVLFQSIKTKNGVTTRTVDSLFIPAGTTRDITVTY